jgi:hypothetical protein
MIALIPVLPTQRRLAILVGELEYGDTEPPDVGFGVVRLCEDDLGRHPVGCADKGGSFGGGRGGEEEWGRDAKVAEDDSRGGGEEDVGSLTGGRWMEGRREKKRKEEEGDRTAVRLNERIETRMCELVDLDVPLMSRWMMPTLLR